MTFTGKNPAARGWILEAGLEKKHAQASNQQPYKNKDPHEHIYA